LAGRGSARRVFEFLDIEHSIQEDAAESYAFLAKRYPEQKQLLRSVFKYSEGVHILKQPVVETVVGYLLSVQSSVTLTRARLEAMARFFPENACVIEGRTLWLFPTVAQLKTLSESMIASLHLGYRAEWLSGLLARIPEERGLQELCGLKSVERQSYFRSYPGIGPKVAACIDLFAYGGNEAFPVDTWVDRGMRHILGFTSAQIHLARDHAAKELGPHCGLFGEYLFRYERDRGNPRKQAKINDSMAGSSPRFSDRTLQ
jgi:N-glycosylase/DNA lyase